VVDDDVPADEEEVEEVFRPLAKTGPGSVCLFTARRKSEKTRRVRKRK